jgi:hypothetical protein
MFHFCCPQTNFPTFWNDLLQRVIFWLGARGSLVGWGSILKSGKSRVRFPMMSLHFSIYIKLPATPWPWGPLRLLTEMCTRDLPASEGLPAHKADNLTTICEPIISTSHNRMRWRPITGIPLPSVIWFGRVIWLYSILINSLYIHVIIDKFIYWAIEEIQQYSFWNCTVSLHVTVDRQAAWRKSSIAVLPGTRIFCAK